MADLPSTARTVIIGGGAVGCSTAYHLAERGHEVLLLERSELTAGSTWHAAGNCPTFSPNWAVMRMQAYSIDLYERLGDQVGYPINYHQTGAVRLAHTKERLREFAHVADMARSQGRTLEMMSVSDLKDRVPWMETHDLVGGLWDARDGDIDPSQLTQAFATGARAKGAQIVRGAQVTSVTREGGEWVIETPKGTVRAENVVNAAGYYAPDIAKMFLKHGGRMPPIVVMAHQYLVTDEIDELGAAPEPMPMIRDPDSSYYLRQEKTALLLGPYEKGGRIHWREADDPRPDDFSFQLFPDDLERIESYIEDACARVPLLGSVGLKRVINGPIPYAPDGLPLIGPMPGVPNAYEAHGFTFGIIQGGGAGKLMADWITEGETEWDAWSLDPRRFTGFADDAYAAAKGKEIYDNEYAIHFPHLHWPEGRDKRLSALHERHQALGAVFAPFGGWERVHWYTDAPVDEEAHATYERKGPWFECVSRECKAVQESAGVIDLTGFSRFRLSGEGAAQWLEGRFLTRLPKTGRVGLGYAASESGRFAAEMTITRLAEDDFLLITAAAAEWRDGEWLRQDLPDTLTLENVTEGAAVLLVTGPEARKVLSSVLTADLSLPWLSHQRAEAAGFEFDLLRVSFAGELGWELHMPAEAAPAIFEAILEQGATPFGMAALDALRLEKGYLGWESDLTTDVSLLELGLARRILPERTARGARAIASERQRGAARRIASLSVETNGLDPAPLSSVWSGERQVGLVTTAGWGHRVGGTVAIALLDVETPEGPLEVDVFGKRYPARLSPTLAQWDPENTRLRA
ncbi:MAG: FAD-dependent oxidoreductase [Pseudomonadota bacterium]